MEIHKVKTWLDIKKNAQFKYLVFENYRPDIVERLCDGKTFSLGIKSCVEGNWDLEYVQIEKFHTDLIHISGKLYFNNGGNCDFTCEINDIGIENYKITGIKYKPGCGY
jgi:hypothetical protein